MLQKARNVTQDDVAHHAGVSRSVVSYVINNGPRQVSEETRGRVLAAIKELGYRPNRHAQILSSPDETVAEKYVGIVLAGNYMFNRPYYGSILASIHESAHEKGLHIRFIRVFEDFNNPTLFNELIHPNEINGVILIGLDQVLRTPEDHALIEQITQRVKRIVCVDWEWPGIPSILFDRHNGAYQATHHLLAAGKSRVAYIGPDDKRVSGYQQALWEKDIPLPEGFIQIAVDSESGYECCERLMELPARIDAICAGTDQVAIGVLHCLYRHGLQVPQDVAIASIDNLDISAFTIPALTTIDIPKHEIGYLAIETITSNYPRKNASAFAITVQTRLIVRESSASAL